MSDTIAAVSTAPAAGGIGIVRISGGEARTVADRVFRSVSGRKIMDTEGYRALFGHVYDENDLLDEAVALVFSAPHSYTGEDVVELSCHGGLYITQALLHAAFSAGARPAQPGEFTRRAFENGKMSLNEAESVMDLIGAQGKQAARSALSAKGGALTKKISSLTAELADCASWLGAWADFPEEDIEPVEPEVLSKRLSGIRETLRELLSGYDTGRLIREGVNTVIVGRPNVGKSALMNRLSGQQSSIVTEYAGTTRDVVTAPAMLGGLLLHLSDTAGMHQTNDPVEKLGVERARECLTAADLVLAVFDRSEVVRSEDRELLALLPPGRTVVLLNKCDLPAQFDVSAASAFPSAAVSAITGQGMEDLEKAVVSLLGTSGFDPSAALLSGERQYACAAAAEKELGAAMDALTKGMTLDAVSVCVENALLPLLELTGERVTDRVADGVFHRFCVGK